MICSSCQQPKQPDEMVKDGGRAAMRGWTAGECKACKRQRSRGYPKRRKRAIVLRQRYGITPEDYDRLYESQGGACAICRRPWRSATRGGLYVDHDHATGHIRGLLCPFCNTSLEWMLIHAAQAEQYVRGLISK